MLPSTGITSLSPWERQKRQLKPISLQKLCKEWKTSTVSVSQRYILKKIKQNMRTWHCRYLRKWVWAKCCMLNVYSVVPLVRRINKQIHPTELFLKTPQSNPRRVFFLKKSSAMAPIHKYDGIQPLSEIFDRIYKFLIFGETP